MLEDTVADLHDVLRREALLLHEMVTQPDGGEPAHRDETGQRESNDGPEAMLDPESTKHGHDATSYG
jgi:hypothetical protein